jgi:hypothetical protein
MQVPFFTAFVPDLSQQDRAAVPQLRNVVAELMARVQHRQGFASGKPPGAAKIFYVLRAVDFLGVKINQRRGVRIKTDQVGTGCKRRGL